MSTRTHRARIRIAALALAVVVALLPEAPSAKGKRLRLPPNVNLRPDRGMTFGRYPKIEHDQRVFKPINQATRLRTIDPAIEPYRSPVSSPMYSPHSGEVSGGLVDADRSLRRAQDAARRRRQQSRSANRESATRSNAPASAPAPKTPRSGAESPSDN